MPPLLCQYDYFVMDFIRELKKNTNVKRCLQSAWTSNVPSGGDSIFDDFFGGSSTSAQQQKEEEKKEDNKLTVEEQKILEVVTFESSQRGFSLISLIVMNEN